VLQFLGRTAHRSIDRDEAGERLCGSIGVAGSASCSIQYSCLGLGMRGGKEGSGELLVFGGQTVDAAFQCFGWDHRVRKTMGMVSREVKTGN
jgi:hypothetical protein